jgi:hypothetical protein
MRLHCVEDISVADVARMLQTPQKPLYRRLDKLKDTLRAQLVSAGMSRAAVDDLIASHAMDAVVPESHPADIHADVRPTNVRDGSQPASLRVK